MKTHLGHLLFSIAPDNLGFYRDLMGFLGWDVIYEGDGMLGVGSGETSLWFGPKTKDDANDYDAAGLNHIGIGATSQADVDATAGYLTGLGIATMFETPQHRPEFSSGDGQTYYQVMFESPDRILFEVVYTGPEQS
ncbi:MAG: VOC family protein [Dehalococcoidia bacterium]